MSHVLYFPNMLLKKVLKWKKIEIGLATVLINMEVP